MATSADTDAWSEAYTEIECTVCLRKKTVKNADHYCFDCQKYMCSDCLRIHDNFGDTHNVLSVSDERVLKILTEKCEEHPEKVIELYCRQHDAVLCNTCVLLGHRKCKDLTHINQLVNKTSVDEAIQAIPGHLQSALDHVNQVIEALDTHLVQIQTKKDMFLKDLEEYARSLVSKIKQLRKRGKDDISATHQQLTTKAKVSRQACEDIKDRLTKYEKEISQSNNRRSHLFVLTKKCRKITKRAGALCSVSEQMIKETSFWFRQNLRVAERLSDVNELVSKTELYTGRLTNMIHIRIPKDHKECDIRDCCRLGDGTLLLVDFNNKRLKRVDPITNTVTDYYDMDRYPLSVCSISHKEVMVATGYGSYVVQVFSHVDKLIRVPTRDIVLGHDTYRIACHDGELFTADCKSLHVHELTGKLKQDISMEFKGMSMFTKINGITVNESGDRVYIADADKGLRCLSRDSRDIFRFTNSDLGVSKACSVTMGNREYVFVSGYLSKNVVQVTEDGRILGDILSPKDGIKKQCLCYDYQTHRLYVGGPMDHILGFDLI